MEANEPGAAPARAFLLWCRSTWATREVVGERAHEDAIRAVIGDAHRAGGAEHRVTAILIPEPSNPFDANAVAVHVEGQRVGYLSRDDAILYRPVLAELLGTGHYPAAAARIWAADYEDQDWDDDGVLTVHTRFGAGVRLALDEPHLVLPANPPPSEPFVLLPHGSPIQVHATDAHLAQLAPLIGPKGQQWVYASLHKIEQQLPRSTRTIVEVHIDGDRIGHLSPKLSTDLLPAVRYLNDRDLTAAVRALLAGNRTAVAVKVHSARAHELDDSWFDEAGRGRPAGSSPASADSVGGTGG